MIITNKIMEQWSTVEKMPWWLILIIILAILIVVMILIPLVRYLITRKDEQDVKKLKSVERLEKQPVKDKANSSYMGFNWFGKKQAIRTTKMVYVQEVEDPCPLCAPFENQVISLEEYGQNVTLMSEAISVGYHHLGCKHVDLDYFHGSTIIPEFHWSKEHKQQRYALRLQQYQFEEKIRNLKYQIDNEIKDQKIQKQLLNQLKFQEEELTNFCEKNDLVRNLSRENYVVNELKKFS